MLKMALETPKKPPQQAGRAVSVGVAVLGQQPIALD
jgi:hypothetical protein